MSIVFFKVKVCILRELPTRTTRIAAFPAEQTTQTHSCYRAAYVDYAAFLGY